MDKASAGETVDGAGEKIEGYASLKRLFVFLKPFAPMLTMVFLMTLSVAGLSMLIPKVVGDVIDNSLKQGNLSDLNSISLYLLFLILCMALLRYFSSYFLGRVGAKLLRQLRSRLFEHIVFLSLNFFQKRQGGELNARITSNLQTIQQLLTSEMLGGIQSALQMIGIVVILFYTNFELTIIALAACLPVIVISSIYGGLLESSFVKISDALANSSANVEEVVKGIDTVQAFGREQAEISRYRRLMGNLFGAQMLLVKRESTYNALLEFFGFSAIAVVLWFGGKLILNDQLSIGDLTACLMYMLIFAFSVQEIGIFFANLKELTGVSHRVFQILDEQPLVKDKGPATIDRARPLHIELSNVSFSYPANAGKTVLNDVSLDIKEGEKIAIVGPTGSGKTTLFKLLMRFYDLQDGSIRVNGIDQSAYRLDSLRNLFGLVSQDIFLFSGTVYENISYVNNRVSAVEVEDAIEAIGATEFIDSLKHGLQEQVGVGGSRLSGGQRQLLGLARIYLKNPRVLLLDEATSSLDSESEEKIQNSLKKLKENRTTLVIAHRLATVVESERIVVLQGGNIIAMGDHIHLIKNCELYSKYWRWQSRGADPVISKDIDLAIN
ncbi:ABC transporter ATP-binding protein [Exilibacterium tricleocarpae]|uniref:ABC transporter ATP-binding protein n=1 Tax=Exilibacterium tricleocarpae TaxID=2591008 RepID=A0A545U3I4_9GAMM|nr:ABC transporter ATP-binding protein [Exilibacterium tricleocarpae]TQV83984.1 ABC transporter ATP-binding protein [Exilibacterium tricleocarpae]